mgnify:CR=1 FL=1
MRAARLCRGLAVCLACCALLSGCSMGYAPLSPTPADPVSAQAALDALYPRVYDDGSRVLYQVTEQEDIP